VARSVVLIPARYGSTRLQGKMLLCETGKPLIQHVYEAALSARKPERTIVATDDKRILRAVESFGGECVMTDPDRGLDAEIIFNLQGDEPRMEGRVIDEVIEALEKDDTAVAATAAVPLAGIEEHEAPSVVKVITDKAGHAIYFSRARIPYDRDRKNISMDLAYKHLGIYAYRRDFLLRYSAMDPTPLEQCEMLEQLRMLENGFAVRVIITESDAHGIDTIEDYREFVETQKNDGC